MLQRLMEGRGFFVSKLDSLTGNLGNGENKLTASFAIIVFEQTELFYNLLQISNDLFLTV